MDKKHRIYAPLPTAPRIQHHHPTGTPDLYRIEPAFRPAIQEPRATPIQREADRFIVGHFAPPAVVVDESYQILYIRGSTEAFLEPASGERTHNGSRHGGPGHAHPPSDPRPGGSGGPLVRAVGQALQEPGQPDRRGGPDARRPLRGPGRSWPGRTSTSDRRWTPSGRQSSRTRRGRRRHGRSWRRPGRPTGKCGRAPPWPTSPWMGRGNGGGRRGAHGRPAPARSTHLDARPRPPRVNPRIGRFRFGGGWLRPHGPNRRDVPGPPAFPSRERAFLPHRRRPPVAALRSSRAPARFPKNRVTAGWHESRWGEERRGHYVQHPTPEVEP